MKASCLLASRSGVGGKAPVVVGVASIIPLLDLTQVAAQLALIQRELLDMTCLREQMEGQQRQGVARCCFCQPKYVKLPVLLCSLQFR